MDLPKIQLESEWKFVFILTKNKSPMDDITMDSYAQVPKPWNVRQASREPKLETCEFQIVDAKRIVVDTR